MGTKGIFCTIPFFFLALCKFSIVFSPDFLILTEAISMKLCLPAEPLTVICTRSDADFCLLFPPWPSPFVKARHGAGLTCVLGACLSSWNDRT